MNTYINISSELKAYFSKHPIFRILLPLHMVFLFGGVGLLLINNFASIGNFLSALAYYAFLLGLLLSYASLNQKNLYIGMFIYSVMNLYYFFRSIIKFKYVNFNSLFSLIIFGGLAYLIFKHASISSSGANKGRTINS